jgi:hypothetical protein
MLTIGIIPQSLSHIAFPATYTAGTVGWRQPGFWGWHTFGDDLKFEFAWSIQRSGWVNTPAELATSGGVNAGIASGLPAFEARGKFMFGKAFNLWVSGPGVIAVPANLTDLVTVLGTVGMNGNLGPIALAGSAWYGKNAGPLLGNVLQFSPPTNPGNIMGWGAWGQIGMNATKNMSLWFTYGIDHPLYADIISINAINPAVNRLRNQNMVVMARYQDGGFAIGAEYLYTRTTTIGPADVIIGNQISVTGNYYF